MPANAWFDSERDLDSPLPAEADMTETNPLDPTDPEGLQRLLQALRKL